MTARTTEDHSAKKKARQGKQRVFPVVLLLCVLFSGLGAGLLWFLYAPVPYSDADVDAYVENAYGDGWSLTKKGRSADRAGWEYHYAQENGESFSVFSVNVPVYRDGVASGRYRKALFDNYYSTRIEKKKEELEELARVCREEKGPQLEIEVTGEETGAYGARYGFCLYLEKDSQIEAAAELLTKMDALLAFAGRKREGSGDGVRTDLPCVDVYLKPDGWLAEGADAVTSAAKAGGRNTARAGGFVDWQSPAEREAFRISRIPLTDAGSGGKLHKTGLMTRLENDYVDAAKTFGRDYYSISGSLWSKYPAPVLMVVNAGGHALPTSLSASALSTSDTSDTSEPSGTSDPSGPSTPASDKSASAELSDSDFTYQFVYHRRSGTYWMTGLDPCEDFDGNPFGAYPRRGAFAKLVRLLGGSYSADQWSGNWRIGSKHWSADLETQKTPENPWACRDVILSCDGNRVLLDQVPGILKRTGGSPAGRPYSIHDLIRMLDVRITINQKEMTAVMFRDYTNE